MKDSTHDKIAFILASVIVAIVVYLCFVFIRQHFNPALWLTEARFVYVIVVFFAMLIMRKK